MTDHEQQKVTLQDIFDYGWQAFVVECKPRCIDELCGDCLYDDGKGNHCAVGGAVVKRFPELLMTDVLANFSELVVKYADKFDSRLLEMLDQYIRKTYGDVCRLDDIQSRLHDSLPDAHEIPETSNLRSARQKIYEDFAEEYGLTIPGSEGADHG